MWSTYLQPTGLDEALKLAEHYGLQARLIAGGTDMLIELQRGIKPTETLIDLSSIAELKYIREEQGFLALGALTTHNDVLKSTLCHQHALSLVQACQEVGAPQIRTRATVGGNLLTASPANDTIPPLLALDAELVLASNQGERTVPLTRFYRGVRRTDLQPGELLREIRIPVTPGEHRRLFLKLGLRRSQAISVINLALNLTLNNNQVCQARIALGCVAPTVIRAHHVEDFLQDQSLEPTLCLEAAQQVTLDCSPIDDIRASASYRRTTLTNLLAQGLMRLSRPEEPPSSRPVLLETDRPAHQLKRLPVPLDGSIQTTINGTDYCFTQARHKTLLNLLREDAGLTGSKEGCAEGECGACTTWLNGQAVMSCLIPAAQAHGANVTTIEGLGGPDQLHPLQQAFIDCAAVQCGFCIPGMLMAGARLLEEHPHPDQAQMRTALSGNICRCTGYRKILDALARAGDAQ